MLWKSYAFLLCRVPPNLVPKWTDRMHACSRWSNGPWERLHVGVQYLLIWPSIKGIHVPTGTADYSVDLITIPPLCNSKIDAMIMRLMCIPKCWYRSSWLNGWSCSPLKKNIQFWNFSPTNSYSSSTSDLLISTAPEESVREQSQEPKSLRHWNKWHNNSPGVTSLIERLHRTSPKVETDEKQAMGNLSENEKKKEQVSSILMEASELRITARND